MKKSLLISSLMTAFLGTCLSDAYSSGVDWSKFDDKPELDSVYPTKILAKQPDDILAAVQQLPDAADNSKLDGQLAEALAKLRGDAAWQAGASDQTKSGILEELQQLNPDYVARLNTLSLIDDRNLGEVEDAYNLILGEWNDVHGPNPLDVANQRIAELEASSTKIERKLRKAQAACARAEATSYPLNDEMIAEDVPLRLSDGTTEKRPVMDLQAVQTKLQEEQAKLQALQVSEQNAKQAEHATKQAFLALQQKADVKQAQNVQVLKGYVTIINKIKETAQKNNITIKFDVKNPQNDVTFDLSQLKVKAAPQPHDSGDDDDTPPVRNKVPQGFKKQDKKKQKKMPVFPPPQGYGSDEDNNPVQSSDTDDDANEQKFPEKNLKGLKGAF
jgi:hypothetical protein